MAEEEKFMADEKKLQSVRDEYHRVLDKMKTAAVKSGRDEDAVRLMCVTKTVEPEYINAVIDEGASLIGENKVQEYLGKREFLHLEGVEKHLIGHLQTNKVGKIVKEADMIESVDSYKLAKEISRVSVLRGVNTKCLVEVNIGMEESKSGVPKEHLEELLNYIATLPGIRVKGLMTIPPVCETEYESRKYFSSMYKTFIDIRGKNIDNIDMEVLSMGMSGDFEAAIAEGSNLIRVGSAIFGKRIYH